MDPDDLTAHSRLCSGFPLDGLGPASHLEASNHPRVGRGYIVDHECDLTIGGDIAKFGSGAHVPTADVNGARIGIDDEADRAVLEAAVGGQRGETAQALRGQIVELGIGEDRSVSFP